MPNHQKQKTPSRLPTPQATQHSAIRPPTTIRRTSGLATLLCIRLPTPSRGSTLCRGLPGCLLFGCKTEHKHAKNNSKKHQSPYNPSTFLYYKQPYHLFHFSFTLLQYWNPPHTAVPPTGLVLFPFAFRPALCAGCWPPTPSASGGPPWLWRRRCSGPWCRRCPRPSRVGGRSCRDPTPLKRSQVRWIERISLITYQSRKDTTVSYASNCMLQSLQKYTAVVFSLLHIQAFPPHTLSFLSKTQKRKSWFPPSTRPRPLRRHCAPRAAAGRLPVDESSRWVRWPGRRTPQLRHPRDFDDVISNGSKRKAQKWDRSLKSFYFVPVGLWVSLVRVDWNACL